MSDLSYGQKALYFMQRLDPASTSYNIGMAFKFFHKFDEVIFRAAVEALMSNHEILKTIFKNENGKIYQYINEKAVYELHIIEVQSWDETTVTKKVNEDFHTSYHLLNDPLLRIYLYKHESYDLVNFVVHHIIADFNSVEIMLNDFIKSYSLLEHKLKPEFVGDGPTYEAFVKEEDAFVHSEKFGLKINEWKKILSDLDEGLDFNLDSKESVSGEAAGDKVEFRISEEEKNRISRLCENLSISPFVFFLTVYKLFIFQMYGKRDVVVGVPVSLRRSIKYRRVVGNFVNLLPVRMKTNDRSFAEDAKYVSTVFVQAMLNKKVPYSLLVQSINPGRDRKYPIFQTTFNYLSKKIFDSELIMDQSISERQSIFGYEIEAFPVKQQLDQMDLSLEFIEHNQGFTGLFKYNKNIFNKELVTDYTRRYKDLLLRILDDTDSNVENLRYFDAQERDELIYATGQNYKEFPAYDSVMDIIDRVADGNPQGIALRDESSCYTYHQLKGNVNRFAAFLKDFGIKKGDPVIVCMERRTEVVIAFLAIMKAGGIYVPVDISFPENRIKYILENTSASGVVSTRNLVKKETFLEHAICIDTVLASDFPFDPEYSKVKINPEDSAYIIFTSGSTGEPKGVEIQHKALVNFLQSMELVLGLKDKKEVNIGGVTSISFDISILEFLLPLITGGQSTLLMKKTVTDAELFDKSIRTFGINIFQATATTWKMILSLGWKGDKAMDVLIGGEMVSKDLAQKLLSGFQTVWNVYGPTEATIWATAKCLSAKDKVVSIGLPLHNMEAYILDEKYQIVQKKVIGKLYLAGAGLAKGYYKREELTNSRFFETQFYGEKKRLYDTGDLAKYLDNGEIEVIGRTDDQVKLGGYRIELGEIEGVLNRFEGIQSISVLIRDQRLAAYMVVNYEIQDNSFLKELKKYCKKELTPYMIPSEFILVDKIPLTPNQKTDRKALAGMKGRHLTDFPREETAPKGLYEEMFCIWKTVLGDFEFGLDDNFFDIGGTSLLALTLQQKISSQMEAEVSVLDVFTYPTIHMLNDFLNHKIKRASFPDNQKELQKGRNRLTNRRKSRGYEI
jgi:amino acid adenylation domain-containing protein